MIGTEHGSVISCNRKGKTPQDKIAGLFQGHLGPVYAVQVGQFAKRPAACPLTSSQL